MYLCLAKKRKEKERNVVYPLGPLNRYPQENEEQPQLNHLVIWRGQFLTHSPSPSTLSRIDEADLKASQLRMSPQGTLQGFTLISPQKHGPSGTNQRWGAQGRRRLETVQEN